MTVVTDINLTGFKELQELLRQLPDELAAGVISKAFHAGAVVVRDQAKINCPVLKEPVPHRTPGEVKDAIKIVKPSKAVKARTELLYIVRCKHPLAHIIEYGSYLTGIRYWKSGKSTGTMPAISFMRKAADEKLNAAIDVIKAKCEQGIDKAAVTLAKRLKATK